MTHSDEQVAFFNKLIKALGASTYVLIGGDMFSAIRVTSIREYRKNTATKGVQLDDSNLDQLLELQRLTHAIALKVEDTYLIDIFEHRLSNTPLAEKEKQEIEREEYLLSPEQRAKLLSLYPSG